MQTNFDELEQSEQRLNKEKREAQREVSQFFSSTFSSFFQINIWFRANPKDTKSIDYEILS